MKKVVVILIVLIILQVGATRFLTTGFLVDDEAKVRHICNWTFQHNLKTSDYSLFFSLKDDSGNELKAPATVDICIKDNNNKILYEGTKQVTKENYGYYTNVAEEERLYADVRIKENEIKKGNSSSGKVYFTVHNDDYFAFDEVNCDAYYCLPVKESKLVVKNELPEEFAIRGFDGSVESKIKITKVNYTFEGGSLDMTLNIEVIGEKTYESSSGSLDEISYKLYDSNEYLIDSGDILFDSDICVGDKFKDDSTEIYDVKPGEKYTLVFMESKD